jgi:hypothetical protein
VENYFPTHTERKKEMREKKMNKINIKNTVLGSNSKELR